MNYIDKIEFEAAIGKNNLDFLLIEINNKIDRDCKFAFQKTDLRIHYAELFFNGEATLFNHKQMIKLAQYRELFFHNDPFFWSQDVPEENLQSIGNMRFFSNMETFFDNLKT